MVVFLDTRVSLLGPVSVADLEGHAKASLCSGGEAEEAFCGGRVESPMSENCQGSLFSDGA